MIKLRGQEFEVKFGYKSHKELQKLIKESGQEPVDFIDGKEALVVQIGLRHCLPDVTIEEIENEFENLNMPQIMDLITPYLKFYSPNAVLPKL